MSRTVPAAGVVLLDNQCLLVPFAGSTLALAAHELIVDLFAGGGGASLGIERAMGRPVDIAVDHSAVAIAAHERNHPRTTHYREDAWRVDPREVCAGRPVGLLWASPICTHFSRASGNANPKSAKIRSLAWVVIRWARGEARGHHARERH